MKVLSAVILLVMLLEAVFYKVNSLTTSGSCLCHSPTTDEFDRYYIPSKLSGTLCLDVFVHCEYIFDEKKKCHT